MDAKSLLIPVSPGELVDKMTILEIKRRQLDGEQRAHVESELSLLASVAARTLPGSEALDQLWRELAEVNDTLWRIEDRLRLCERQKEFGASFVELARRVYLNNDRRASLKRRINELLGSEIVEEKSYTPYVR